MKNLHLDKKIKEKNKNIYPTSYKTSIDSLHKLNMKDVYEDIEKSLNGTDSNVNVGIASNTIYIYFDSIKILSENANKVQRIDTSFTQQIIEETLKELIKDLEGYPLDKIERILNVLAFLKIPYKPRYISYRLFKADLEKIKYLIKNEIVSITSWQQASDFLKKIEPKLFSYDVEKNNVFTNFFLPVVLFTFDKIKELINQYESIEIYGENVNRLFGLWIKENEPLIFSCSFYLLDLEKYVNVKLSYGVSKYTFREFLIKFFVFDFQQYVKNTTGKSIRFKHVFFALETIFTKSISLFILHYLLSFFDLKLLFKSNLYPQTITLKVIENQDGLEISDDEETFTFEKYNVKFLNNALPLLKEHGYLAFFIEAGVLQWKPVDNKFFHHNKFSLENNFLFILKIIPKHRGSIFDPLVTDFEKDKGIETYGGVDAVLRALDFLTDGHYEKDFLYKIAFIFFKNQLVQ